MSVRQLARPWISWLRALAFATYILTLVYIYFRPTSEEYARATGGHYNGTQIIGGSHFASDLSGNSSTLFSHLWKALVDHWASLGPSTFFSFLLFSIGFAMIWWLLNTSPTLDTLALRGPRGYTRAAIITLLSTILIIAASAPVTGDRIGVAAILTALALATVIVLYGWQNWGGNLQMKEYKEEATPPSPAPKCVARVVNRQDNKLNLGGAAHG